MPKICPECQVINAGLAARCKCGFDLSSIEVPGLVRAAAPAAPAAPFDSRRFFLLLGQFLSVVGALFSAAGALFAFAYSLLKPGAGLEALVSFLGGVFGLVFWMAMFAVFAEVLRLRARVKRLATRALPAPAPEGERQRETTACR